MVRTAQQAGDLRVMYPDGCERVTDIPWYLQVAIEFGLTVLSWMENLREALTQACNDLIDAEERISDLEAEVARLKDRIEDLETE